jgi:proline iminopeptidase
MKRRGIVRLLTVLGITAAGIVGCIAILFGLFYLLTIGEYPVPKTVAQDSGIPHVTINGVIYHAETFGDPSKPVVITVHGGPGGDYRSILPLQKLSDQYYVVFFDQRGAGLSPRVDPEQITLESAIADLDSVVNHFGHGDPVDLVGHSWGAMLASAYLGRYPEKAKHAVLAEPGFLTAEFAQQWAEATKIRFSLGLLYHFIRTKFESLHVKGPDEYAADDYFGHQMNLYQGDDHPQAGYRCDGGGPTADESWRYGAAAADSLFQEAVDSNGNFTIDLTTGVEQFSNTVLFMAGECQKIIGAGWQRRQMQFFKNTELAVVPKAGHEMFLENPQDSIEIVREYLSRPAQ